MMFEVRYCGTRYREKAGFTFLELLVVVTLLSILSAAVVPLYGASMAGLRLRSVQNDFISLLSFVQERAVVESREYRLYLNESEGSYFVMYLAEHDGRRKIFEYVEGDFGVEQFLPEYIKLDKVKAREDRDVRMHYIACFPNGACDRATIAIQDTRSRSRRVEISTLGSLGKFEVKR